jgi:carotenoid cleavage dioxygenase
VTPEWPIFKHDLQTGERWTWSPGPGRGSGEAVFIGRPGSTDEDDGWLMSMVHDVPNESTELVVLDAQDIGRGPVATVMLPRRVPYGFHGNWVSDASVPPTAHP